ncbi:hypothetical protein BO79DRAFT_275070 [Aspergillus costaricaensis CBS 115574]|uniref:Uncharacterized protein n=1 Tax=Aspergillus costaricaensis CBS 115574 TaxID=1448317 RepID=A0ACD1ISA4_9EURO|nr:hypothetical protein BO79DRAFT_275070 [Aspergillus costaricaensis CBS 115574]RAK92635.1 hypothetical protein BO79DRAFT_275070 [Aspergillus costaricaensis CBS 115574]
MRLSAFFQAFWAVATISTGLVVAAPRGQPHASLNKRTTTYFCDSSATATLTYSIGEMIEMLTTAIDRTNSLQVFLADPPNHISGQGQLLQSTFYTFEAIFGQLEYGAGDGQNDAAIARVEQVLSIAKTMQSSLRTIGSNEHMEIYCSDFWLVEEDPEGDISLINPYLYWDNRDTRTGPRAMDFAVANGICRDKASHYAWVDPYMSSSQTSSGQTTVMTLCQDYVSQWVSRHQSSDTMTAASQQNYAANSVHINQFQGLTMSTALMHEFTHAPAIVGANYLIDEKCEIDGIKQSAYGWDCIRQLAATPSTAMNNADSFSFYISAMYLSTSDWSTGFSNPIPQDTTPAYDDGLASMMSKLTID